MINGIRYEQSTNSHTYDVVDDIGKLYISFVRDITPIPLTEEILLKCGLKMFHYGANSTRSLKAYKLGNFECRFWGGVASLHGYNSRHQDILYLHQLQNLYFALTGKELEVKL